MRSTQLAIGALALLLFGPGLPAQAAIVNIIGASTGAQATATADSTFDGTTLTVVITNTSPFDALITGIGYDLPPLGNEDSPDTGLDGFTGDITTDNSTFTFSDGDFGNIPQVDDAVADFGFLTGGSFAAGDPQLALHPGFSETYTVEGPFGSLTEAQVINAIGVRFQRVGLDGEGSDVGGPGGTPFINPTVIPEPSSLVLTALGVAGLWGARRRGRMQP